MTPISSSRPWAHPTRQLCADEVPIAIGPVCIHIRRYALGIWRLLTVRSRNSKLAELGALSIFGRAFHAAGRVPGPSYAPGLAGWLLALAVLHARSTPHASADTSALSR
jgi:hypothetical protein